MNSSFFCFFRKNFTKFILACQQIQFQSSKPGIVFSANTVAVEESEKKRSDRNGVAPDSTQGCISQKLDKWNLPTQPMNDVDLVSLPRSHCNIEGSLIEQCPWLQSYSFMLMPYWMHYKHTSINAAANPLSIHQLTQWPRKK